MANTKIPSELLDDASITSAKLADDSVTIAKLNVTDGTNGQYLQTDGSGTLSFSTVSGYTDSDVETYLDGGTSTPTFSTATVSGTFTVNTDADSTLTIADGGTDAVTLYGGTGDELYIGANNAYKLRFKTDGNIVMDNGGNLGIGTSSPTTWAGELLQTGSKSLYGQLDVNGAAYVANNVAYDGSNWKYVTSDTGSLYAQDPTSSNSHIWYTVADGTAGATATLSERMRIDASGYVGINNTVASTVSGGYTNLVIGSGTASDSGISIYNSTSGTGRIHFADGTTTGDRYDGFIAYKHNVRELLIGAGTSGGTVAFFSQHGFHPNPSDSGSAVAANALDDYEHGTYSHGSLAAYGVCSAISQGSFNNNYVKVGKLITITGIFSCSFSGAGKAIVTFFVPNLGTYAYSGEAVFGSIGAYPKSQGHMGIAIPNTAANNTQWYGEFEVDSSGTNQEVYYTVTFRGA